ncbi:MAG: hypothetical protein ACTSR8_12670 [Promethearchaeota archaeon]
MNKLYIHGIYIWLIIGLCTIILGIIRESVLIPATGVDGTTARITLIPVAIFYIFVLTYILLKKETSNYTQKDTIILGILWLTWTIIFEFIFGSVVMGNSIDNLIADYNIFAGRIWGLFLISLLIAPYLINNYILKKE